MVSSSYRMYYISYDLLIDIRIWVIISISYDQIVTKVLAEVRRQRSQTTRQVGNKPSVYSVCLNCFI